MSEVHCDIDRLMATLNQIGDRAARGVSAAMVAEAENIVELARSYAPVDDGDLESAIKFEADRGGINRRTRVMIFIDTDAVKANGGLVKNYAIMMHEGLAPYGSGAFSLGPKSVSKRNSGNDVGGKFLERAVEDRLPALVKRIANIAARAIR